MRPTVNTTYDTCMRAAIINVSVQGNPEQIFCFFWHFIHFFFTNLNLNSAKIHNVTRENVGKREDAHYSTHVRTLLVFCHLCFDSSLLSVSVTAQ